MSLLSQPLDQTKGVFADLARQEAIQPGTVGGVTRAFEAAIHRSFANDDASRVRHGLLLLPGTRTRAEMKRRFDICARLFGVMRGDLKWSLQRCKDELPRALQAELDGGYGTWKPDERRGAWAAAT